MARDRGFMILSTELEKENPGPFAWREETTKAKSRIPSWIRFISDPPSAGAPCCVRCISVLYAIATPRSSHALESGGRQGTVSSDSLVTPAVKITVSKHSCCLI